MDKYGLREEKYDWLNKNDFLNENYIKIEPQTPYYFLVKRNTEKIKEYLNWTKITEIFPVNGVGMTTARDKFVIDFEKRTVENRIRLFKNSKYDDEYLHKFFQINKKKGWDIRKAWNMLQHISDSELKNFIYSVTYRPFDNRYIFWHDSVVWRTVKRVMSHMLEENIGLLFTRPSKPNYEFSVFITINLIDQCVVGNKTAGAGISYLSPLFIYTNENKKDLFNQHQTEKEPNIPQALLEKLSIIYGQENIPEDILYYIYGVFYSTIYRETYAEFLKIDFPRVPFTGNYDLFKKMVELGKELADLHLLKSPALSPPVAKYQGSGDNDRIEKITYTEDEQRIYINKDKYFEGIAPEVWNYYIGGYQVLHKYLKDRKDRIIDDVPRYCRIVTALSKTIEIQEKIDEIYPEIENETVGF